jgi:hypothetical protein
MRSINRVLTWWLLSVSVTALAQQPAIDIGTPDSAVMLAAVSRDDSVLLGGIGTGKLLGTGKLSIEPMVWLISDGAWKSINCDPSRQKDCRNFEEIYLNKPHAYTIVSADGRGATVNAAPTTLSECFDYTGSGTYTGPPIRGTAIAASSTEMFTTGPSAKRLSNQDAEQVRKALSVFVPAKLDSLKGLRIYSHRLEVQDLFVVQRAYQDFASKPGYNPQEDHFKFIFAIGTMAEGHFHLLYWKKIEDENELVLGTIHLKSGRDFLVTTVSDPESQSFRIYGLKDGRLTLVFSGGGASC